MVFSSLIFLFMFLPLVLIIYYVSPKVLRNCMLFIVSLIFYAWGEPVYIVIMIFSTIFDYINGVLIDKYRDRKGITKAIFINSIIINLGILGFFKYYGFVVDNINTIFNLNLPVETLPLPVGISFYTFQTMSYVIDVYLGKVQAQKNIISFGTYVTMFPQLVAGPIIKYSDIDKQLQERKVTLDRFGEGMELFVRGLALKVLLANNIGLLWTSVKETSISELTIITAWMGIIAFAFQIYFDFRGYSAMAQGLGKMFGFDFPENFNYPYISKSVTEFWRRWHISLGSWFREYVYIPLGGNRTGLIKQLRNLFIVWFLTGLWHGANWNFIVWGLYFGLFVTLEKLFLLKWLKNRMSFIGHVYTLIIVLIGWVFFEFENLSVAMNFLGTMFGFNQSVFLDNKTLYYITTNFMLFIVLAICSTPFPKRSFVYIREQLKLPGAIGIPVFYVILAVLSTGYLVNDTYNPFLYFRF
ncbi:MULTISPECIES: MBOAT family O-acyltransferase [Bacillus cereus group]|uniref:MBOAT family O-acyltransferase n=1 Tax=Bacillus cereus group TaxID=86661 RepID=UPI000BF2DB63|nr:MULTISPECIES: MBOAT family O-acyltransferase [Bacillus cereus group]MBJ8076194.1 MBOAT family protein [Bacillus cereus group sp. N12]PGE69113.1 transcriptional regulator [Bacillus toyonensis]PHD43209.1 transcriptional regulator [Bacillus toyonensis]PRT12727.1 MBOAT family protein [Bacillus toyonensis]HDR7688958.1 MBOAT family protein [Bacillus toyonensis]